VREQQFAPKRAMPHYHMFHFRDESTTEEKKGKYLPKVHSDRAYSGGKKLTDIMKKILEICYISITGCQIIILGHFSENITLGSWMGSIDTFLGEGRLLPTLQMTAVSLHRQGCYMNCGNQLP
jgi:hypothetical protein